MLRAFVKVQAKYAKDHELARALVTRGESPRDQGLNVAEHAAYAAVSSLILNLDEVLNKE